MQFESSMINQSVAGPVVPVTRKGLIDFVIAQSKTERYDVWVLLDKPEFVSLRNEAIAKGIKVDGYDFDREGNRYVAWILFSYRQNYGINVSYMPYDDQETENYFNNPNYRPGYDVQKCRSHWIFVDIINETPIDVSELI